MPRSVPRELTEPLRRFDADVQKTAIAARKIVLDEIGPCYESVFEIKKWISILYSTTPKRMKDNICLLVVYKDHVNLMFPRGVDLKDPKGLLEGAGKAMRHVKMLTAEDAARPGVRQLISQAKKRPGLGKPPKPGRHVVTSIEGQKAAAARLKPRAPQPAFPRLF